MAAIGVRRRVRSAWTPVLPAAMLPPDSVTGITAFAAVPVHPMNQETGMADQYILVPDVREHTRIPENGILSQTLQNDDRSKIVLFGFSAGQELSAHTAPFPATLTFLKGEATLRLGQDEQQAGEGTFIYMAPYLEHGIKARTDVILLLTMIKK